MTIADTIAKLSIYVGRSWPDVAESIGAIVHDDGFVYRWLEPTTGINLSEFRPDRIDILVDANLKITSYTVG